jgi:4-methyl-5(b-hydroxyethyl)-thiazole monophosphate biosynthesis
MIYLFLADGFEEIEAFMTVDVIRRAGIDIKTVAVGESKTVMGTHSIPVVADAHESELGDIMPEAIILPGGMPGTTNLDNSRTVHKYIASALNSDALICAICAAPPMLGRAGLLKGKRATCFPGFEDALTGAIFTDERVTVDGNFITAKGMGCAAEFALAIVEKLLDKQTALNVAKSSFIC